MPYYQGNVILFNTSTGVSNLETLSVYDADRYYGDGFRSTTPSRAFVTTDLGNRDVDLSAAANVIVTVSNTVGSPHTRSVPALKLDENTYLLHAGASGDNLYGSYDFDQITAINFIQATTLPSGHPATSEYSSYGIFDVGEFPIGLAPQGAEVAAGVHLYTGGTPGSDFQDVELELTLTEGFHYTFYIDDQRFDPRGPRVDLKITDADGNFLDSGDGIVAIDKASIEYVATYTGVHVIEASPVYGYYNLVVKSDDAGGALGEGRLLTDGQVAVGGINSASDLDWYSVDLDAGQSINVTLTGLFDKLSHLGLSVFDPLGLRIDQQSASGDLVSSITATTAGKYHFQISGSVSSSSKVNQNYAIRIGDRIALDEYGTEDNIIDITPQTSPNRVITDAGGGNLFRFRIPDDGTDTVSTSTSIYNGMMVGSLSGTQYNRVELPNISALDNLWSTGGVSLTHHRLNNPNLFEAIPLGIQDTVGFIGTSIRLALDIPKTIFGLFGNQNSTDNSESDASSTVSHSLRIENQIKFDAEGSMQFGVQEFVFKDGETLALGTELQGGSNANDLIVAVGEDATISGGAGYDWIVGAEGDNSLFGGAGRDRIDGNSGDDYLDGGSGQDHLYAGDGNDTVLGASGSDFLFGGSDDDKAYSGSGNDYVELGAGNDYVRVGGGVESFYGGSGTDDYISYYDSAGGVTVNLSTNATSNSWASNDVISGFESIGGSKTGGDTLYGTSGSNRLKGYGGNDKLHAGSGNDKVYGGSGNDYVKVGGGVESFYGGSGSDDYISYTSSTSGINIDLAANTVSGGWANNDKISGFESVGGSSTGGDVMYGTSGANRLKGYGGDDKFYAGAGNDKVYGGSGDDYVRVGGGVESFYGGSGSDDFISYYDSSGGIRIDLQSNTISGSWGNNDKIRDFESASGSNSGNDKMYGTSGANRLKGNGGDDSIWGRSGDDKLYGGNGEDRFDGGGGTDSLYGGAGDDIFHFDRGEGTDYVKDFANNEDTIQFDNFGYLTDAASALAFATSSGGDVTFDFGADGILIVENTNKTALLNDIEIV